MNCNIQVSYTDGVPVVSIQGEIDIYSVPLLKRHLVRLFEAHPPTTVLDMSLVSFADSSVLNLLVQMYKYAQDWEGRMLLVGNEEIINPLMRLSSLDSIFPLQDNIEQAVAHAQ